MELVSKINMRGGDLSDIPLIILCVLICIFHSILYFYALYFVLIAYGTAIKS